MKNKEQFLSGLADELTPVKPLPAPAVRLSWWLPLSFVLVIATMLIVQPFRPGFWDQLTQPRFLFETLLAGCAALSCGYLALALAVPGRVTSSRLHWLVLIPFVLFLLSLAVGMLGSPALTPTVEGHRRACYLEVLLMSWIPVGILIVLVRRAYPLRVPRLALVVGLAGATIPSALMQVACMYSPLHNFLFHALPSVAVTTVVLFLASRLFSRPGQ